MLKMRATLIALSLILSTTPSIAEVRANRTSNMSVTSGLWAVQALAANQTPTNSPYTITWAVNRGTAYSFFVFRNTGSFTVNGFEVSVTQAQTGGSGRPPDTTFNLCSNGTWNATTNTCSGTVVTVGTSADLVLNFTGLNLANGSELSMRATTKPNLQYTFTTTLSVSVSRAKLRNSVLVNS